MGIIGLITVLALILSAGLVWVYIKTRKLKKEIEHLEKEVRYNKDRASHLYISDKDNMAGYREASISEAFSVITEHLNIDLVEQPKRLVVKEKTN